MSQKEEDFFRGKRPWSVIKDQVLGSYMSPYIAKVNKRGQPILLVDAFAGPGIFDDRKPGSPMIMCQAGEKYAKNNYQAIFVNKDETHHKRLESILEKAGWLGAATPLLGDCQDLLKILPTMLTNQTVLLYLDPFGLKGTEFSLLVPFLKRSAKYSTEIILNMSMPIVHRLATRHAIVEGRKNEELIQKYHERLTMVFGGDYWKDILWQDKKSTEERERELITAYLSKIARYLPYNGFCPVREREDKRIKYFIVFASHHPDAMLLMNDIMAKAYFAKMHEGHFAGTLFEQLDWREMRPITDLNQVVLDKIRRHPGETRKNIWLKIVQSHFMRYLEKEYRDSVKNLVKTQKLKFTSSTKRLNNNSLLYPTN